MMRSALIIGSGPAAAATAIALTEGSDTAVTVIDIGLDLEHERRSLVDQMAATSPDQWAAPDVRIVTTQPVPTNAEGLPEKRAYGSDFPFRDMGQLAGISSTPGMNQSLVSAAYGGFSNVWGSQIMPFTEATFASWPVSRSEMEPHYRSILTHIPFAGETDDLATSFPLLAPASPLPPVSNRTKKVLDKYAANRPRLHRLGVTMGRARLAFQATDCVRCGLCMTGCPYSLIYSARATFDVLCREGRVRLLSNLMAVEVGESDDGAYVVARELGGGHQRFEAERLFVACGAIGTTRLVIQSLRAYDRELELHESAQFALPFLSRSSIPDPRTEPQFTLNQFNMTVDTDDLGIDLSMLHFYTYNPAFLDALPSLLRKPKAQPVAQQLLQRLSVALGYLPSWQSPRIGIHTDPPGPGEDLASLTLSRRDPKWGHNAMLRRILLTLVRAAPYLDLWPVLPRLMLSGGAKSYHFGGSFPHRSVPHNWASSDLLGRTGGWQRIHLVDASVFPNVAATTFTLTIMANAHRIASGALTLP